MLYKGGEVSRTTCVEAVLKKILEWPEPHKHQGYLYVLR
jgi:hypothetical protein